MSKKHQKNFKVVKNEKPVGLGTLAEAFVSWMNVPQNGQGIVSTPAPAPMDNLEALKGIEIPAEGTATVVPQISAEEKSVAEAKIAETRELAQNIGTNKVKMSAELEALKETISNAPDGWEILSDDNPVKAGITSAKKRVVEIRTFLSQVDQFAGTAVGDQVEFSALLAEIQHTTEKEPDSQASVKTICDKIVATGRFSHTPWEKAGSIKKDGRFPDGAVLAPWGVYVPAKREDGSLADGQKALGVNFRRLMDAHKEGIPAQMKLKGRDSLSDLFKKGEKTVYIYVPEFQPTNGRKVREGHILLRKFDSSEHKDDSPRWELKVSQAFGSSASLTKESFPFYWLTKGFPAAPKGTLSGGAWDDFSKLIRVLRSAIMADESAKTALQKEEAGEKAKYEAFKKKKAEKEALVAQRKLEGDIYFEYLSLEKEGKLPEEATWKSFLAVKLAETSAG